MDMKVLYFDFLIFWVNNKTAQKLVVDGKWIAHSVLHALFIVKKLFL